MTSARLRKALDGLLNNKGPMRANTIRVPIEALSELRQAWDAECGVTPHALDKDLFERGQTWTPTATVGVIRSRTLTEISDKRVAYCMQMKSGLMKEASCTMVAWKQWVKDYQAVCQKVLEKL